MEVKMIRCPACNASGTMCSTCKGERFVPYDASFDWTTLTDTPEAFDRVYSEQEKARKARGAVAPKATTKTKAAVKTKGGGRVLYPTQPTPERHPVTKLYIAYGSNLNKAAMRRRCPDARPRGKFMLAKAQLVFRGCADVEYHPTAQVPCALWEITRADERVLDSYEGVGSGLYYKEEGIVLKYKGERRNALIYMMRSDGVYPPSQGYVDVVRQGYKDFGLDENYLDEAIKRSFLKKDPDEQTEARRARERRTTARRHLVEMPEAVALRRLELKRNPLGPL